MNNDFIQTRTDIEISDAVEKALDCVEDNAESFTPTKSHRMSKDELQTLPDSKLLEMVDAAKGHTGKDFQDTLNCDFSYSFLTSTLSDRGYVTGWYKAGDAKVSPQPEVVTLHKTSGGDRLTLTVDAAVKDEWHALTDGSSYRQCIANEALSRFIRAVRNGQLKFEVDLTTPITAVPVSHGTRDNATGDVETGGLPDGSV